MLHNKEFYDNKNIKKMRKMRRISNRAKHYRYLKKVKQIRQYDVLSIKNQRIQMLENVYRRRLFHEKPLVVQITNEFGIPSVSVDRQYTASASGQLRTRVQAFVESLEIKNIQKAKEAK